MILPREKKWKIITDFSNGAKNKVGSLFCNRSIARIESKIELGNIGRSQIQRRSEMMVHSHGRDIGRYLSRGGLVHVGGFRNAMQLQES